MRPRLFLLKVLDTFLYHSVLYPMQGVSAKAIYVVSRVRIDGGCFIALREIKPDAIQFNDAGINELVDEVAVTGRQNLVAWQEMFTWVIIKELDAYRTKFYFGGSAELMYIMEVFMVVLRWETEVIGPLFSLPLADI